MCLLVEKGTRVERTSRGKGITVYKVLDYDASVDKFLSPIFSMKYVRGELKQTLYFTAEATVMHRAPFTKQFPDKFFAQYPAVGAGFHTFATQQDAQRYINSLSILTKDSIIVQCRIPRRTLFIAGSGLLGDRELVSLQLRVGKAVAGPSTLVEKFNNTQLRVAPTSVKLRRLSQAIRNNAATFRQKDPEQCVVAIGNRLRSGSTLAPIADNYFSPNNSARFARKFGVTVAEADALNYANYSRLDIGLKDVDRNWDTLLTASVVADVVDKLANKYEDMGK